MELTRPLVLRLSKDDWVEGGAMAMRREAKVMPDGPAPAEIPAGTSERRRQLLLGCGLALLAVSVVGLTVPGSAFEYQRGFPVSDALRGIYEDWGGQAAVALTMAGLALGFVAAVWLSGTVSGRSAERAVFAVAALLAVIFTVTYPSGSSDVFRNIADTRVLWLHGENPKSVNLARYKDDALYEQVAEVQRPGSAYYGPLTYVIYGPAALVSGDSVLANLLTFKGTNALLFVAMVWVVGQAARAVNPGRVVQAMVLIGWNPLVLYEGVANGHNDMTMAAFFVLACFAASSPTRLLASWAVSVGIKYATVMGSPAVLWWLWLRGSRTLVLLLLGAGAATFAVLLSGRPLTGFGIFIESRVFRTPYSAIYYFIEPSVGDDAVYLARYACLGLFAAVVLFTLWKMDGSARSLYAGTFWSVAAASMLAVSYFWPWYYLWFIPVGAVLAGRVEGRLTVLVSVLGLAFYPIFHFSDATQTLNYLLVGLLFGLPAVYAVLELSERPPEAEGGSPGEAAAPAA